ncbi:MAG TPA: thrombospondin type 3 repeat-containing protein [Sandaracinaceae bacterium]
MMARTLAIVSLLWPLPALAQSLPLDDFSSIRFYVAPGPGGFLMVEGAETAPDLTPSFGATLDYAHDPFVADDLDCWTDPTPGPECARAMNQETALVGPLLNLQLYGAITLLERVQVGLNLPVLLFFEGERYSYLDPGSLSPRVVAPGGAGGGLGDPRLSVKVRFLDPDARGEGVMLGAAAWVTAPVGHAMWPRHFVGDRLPSFGAHAIGSVRLGGFRLALNLGGQVREEATNVRSAVGPELTWGVAASYRFHPFASALVEATGATSFGQRFDSEAPTELRAAALVHLGELTIHAGGGAGLVYGVGVPIFRVFAGASFVPRPDPDTDGDGLSDSRDACPADAEDEDGFADEDGCPEHDNDEDGIPDEEDRCRDEPEDTDGHEDEDGCPDPDNDGDGVIDGYDSCPDTPEDRDGDRDTDGCPDEDTDGDGIADGVDRCDDQPEDFDGLADEDGCPETDADEDGVPDDRDECPEEPGDRRRRGCPPGARR